MIHGKNIFLKLKNKIILDNINFEITPQKITCFLGHNGSGKTSLMRCILSLQNKYKGEILFENENIKNIPNHKKAKLISFVFQEFNLFHNLTVFQNCHFPLSKLDKIETKNAEQIIFPIFNDLKIFEIKDQFPSKLSHGQRQKVAIARALCLNPKALILDEPTASLDNQSGDNLAELLVNLKNNGMTIALTSHDKLFTDQIYDRIYHLENGKITNLYERM